MVVRAGTTRSDRRESERTVEGRGGAAGLLEYLVTLEDMKELGIDFRSVQRELALHFL